MLTAERSALLHRRAVMVNVGVKKGYFTNFHTSGPAQKKERICIQYHLKGYVYVAGASFLDARLIVKGNMYLSY